MQIYLVAGHPALAIFAALLVCGLGLYIWATHPGNLTLINFRIKADFRFHKEKELAWRAFKARPGSRPIGSKERRVLMMGQSEFEEWLVTLWASSGYWYNWRLHLYQEWHYSKQFEITPPSPSPIEGEMDNVKYLNLAKTRA